MQKISKQRKVINYLTKTNGRTITSAQARSMFGVKNLRATMSDIRGLVEQYGNWEIYNMDGHYSMNDTHPGKRAYRFSKNGTRSLI